MEIRRDRTFWRNEGDTGGCADMKSRLPGERRSFSRQTAACLSYYRNIAGDG